jgi:hypothetical protein
MSYLAPTGMIFIPCKDGISHNEIEYASPEHVEAGANVLLQVMLQYARGCKWPFSPAALRLPGLQVSSRYLPG